MRLEKFLSDKPLFYKKFDPTRMHKAYKQVKNALPKPRIVHLIGTNGKGSTGRYLADMLFSFGIKVGHYTSPHIISFNERIWINGQVADDALLDEAFDGLMRVLDSSFQDSLSYFEFTTLVAMMAFKECNVVVLEAGLGGEHDATSVFTNELTLLTPVGLDHADFLGDTIEEVATSKIRGIQKAVITAEQLPEVREILEQEAVKSTFTIEDIKLDDRDLKSLKDFENSGKASYLVRNFSHALAALRFLGFKQRVNGKKMTTLFGRLTALDKNLTIDVGHNLLAAKEILKYYGKSKVNLVYNTLADKDYEKILALLKPILSKVFIIDIDDERAVEKEILQTTLEHLEIEHEIFTEVNSGMKTLVFGSFTVVEAFLKTEKNKYKNQKYLFRDK